MFSIYTSLFLIERNSFPWRQSLENFVRFVGEEGELVIAVNQSDDNSLKIIQDFAAPYPNVKVIETNFKYDDIEFDGKVKNAALQATTKPVKIQCDADEIIPISNKPKWVEWANLLLKSDAQCIMVPSIDVFGDINKIRVDKHIGLKFRMHKGGLKRGVWKRAWVNGKINVEMSDSTELLDMNNELVTCAHVIDPLRLHPFFSAGLVNTPYVLHLGFLSFEHRVNINNKLWNEHWNLRSNKKVDNVVTNIKELDNIQTINHNLPIE